MYKTAQDIAEVVLMKIGAEAPAAAPTATGRPVGKEDKAIAMSLYGADLPPEYSNLVTKYGAGSPRQAGKHYEYMAGSTRLKLDKIIHPIEARKLVTYSNLKNLLPVAYNTTGSVLCYKKDSSGKPSFVVWNKETNSSMSVQENVIKRIS